MANKRKIAEVEKEVNSPSSKKQQLQTDDVRSAFGTDLFEPATSQTYQDSYAKSGPYPHAVVPALIEDNLLRKVRSEITNSIHFTLKETDIYRIHQSGDLANLTKLDKKSLTKLPSLVTLRNALYSDEFRQWVSNVTGAGKLSGQKTDMAVNVYTPGSYLLCHDDVIGSRRVSYILYLTDPDKPWKPEWGGGLRLHPTELRKNQAGEEVKVPLAEHSLNIPPSFGQLSFFTVVPGESYHDVEEVYHGKNAEEDAGRIRMAISGWYHIPQEGEDGYEAGLEQALAQKSSLTQLKSAANEFDEPQIKFRHFDEPRTVMNSNATEPEVDPGDEDDQDEDLLTEVDLTFLLQYISASFLAPDMVDQIASSFLETSMLQLEKFFCEKFQSELKQYISKEDQKDASSWKIARPPHKHRYAYLQDDSQVDKDTQSPISRLLVDLLHSHAFKKWLALVTGLKARSLTRQNAIARRFRRGKDYALASPYQGEQPQLEFTIGLTPTTGWEEEEDTKQNGDAIATNGSSASHKSNDTVQVSTTSKIELGGEEVYMAGDDDEDSDEPLHHLADLPSVGRKADPAVYKSSDNPDEEDGILFANAPAWNQFSVVLRDRGTLRFVKYVSQAAKGDRWDVKGEVELAGDAFEGEEEEEEDGDEDGKEKGDGEDVEGKEEEEEEDSEGEGDEEKSGEEEDGSDMYNGEKVVEYNEGYDAYEATDSEEEEQDRKNMYNGEKVVEHNHAWDAYDIHRNATT